MAATSQLQAEVAKAFATLWVVGVLTARVGFHLLIELLYQLRHHVRDFLAQHVRMDLRNSMPMTVRMAFRSACARSRAMPTNANPRALFLAPPS
jgi:hypothetical protein